VHAEVEPAYAEQRDRHKVGQIGAHHEYVAMGEVDEPKHAVNQRVAQGDEGVKTAELQRVQDILKNFHRGTLALK
jgi:hypothetical protein